MNISPATISIGRTAIALLVLLSFTTGGEAAEWRLSAEIPVSPVEPLTAAHGQQLPTSVAPQANGFFAIWTDYRRGYPSIHGALLDHDGAPRERDFVLAQYGHSGHLVPTGTGFLLVYGLGDQTFTAVLDVEGRAVAPAAKVGAWFPFQVVVRGESIYVVTRPSLGGDTASVYSLDVSGKVLAHHADIPGRPLAATFRGSEFVLVSLLSECSVCAPTLTFTSLTDAGPATRPLKVLPPGSTEVNAAASPETVLVVWRNAGSNLSRAVQVIDHEGVTVRDTFLVLHGGTPVWRGDTFAIFRPEPAALRVMRISERGTVMDPAALVIPGPATIPVFAGSDGDGLAVWGDGRRIDRMDAVAAPFTDLGSLDAAAHAAQLIALSGPAALKPRTASIGPNILTAWHNETSLTIEGALDGKHFVVGTTPRFLQRFIVVPGSGRFLVAWYDDDANLIRGGLITLSGDVTPIVPIPRATEPPLDLVTTEGDSFVFRWDDGSTRRRVKTAADGTSSEITVDGTALPFRPETLRDVAAGDRCFTMFTRRLSLGGSPFPSWREDIGLLAECDGSAAPTLLFPSRQNSGSVDAAFDGSRITFVWFESNHQRLGSIVVAQVTPGLDGVSSPRVVRAFPDWPMAGPLTLRLVWNGSEYVLAWRDPFDSVPLNVIRFDRDGVAIDSEPFTVPLGSSTFIPEMMTASANGVTFVYSRPDEENLGAPRIFARTLLRISPPEPRRRRVRP